MPYTPNKLPAFCGTGNFVTVFQQACQLFIISTGRNSLPIFASIFQLLTSLQVLTKILYTFLNAPVHATRLTKPVLGFDHPILAGRAIFQLNWVHRTTT